MKKQLNLIFVGARSNLPIFWKIEKTGKIRFSNFSKMKRLDWAHIHIGLSCFSRAHSGFLKIIKQLGSSVWTRSGLHMACSGQMVWRAYHLGKTIYSPIRVNPFTENGKKIPLFGVLLLVEQYPSHKYVFLVAFDNTKTFFIPVKTQAVLFIAWLNCPCMFSFDNGFNFQKNPQTTKRMLS